MKSWRIGVVLLLVTCSVAFSQQQDFRVHTRGMLHQSVFNTGETGRPLDNGASGSIAGQPSFEWPGYSQMIVDGRTYHGYYNSFGGGLYIAADTGIDLSSTTSPRDNSSTRKYLQCGAATDNGGHSVAVENVYSYPVSLQRIENYPVLSNGELNAAYDPDEAEEIIISKWDTPLGITVTRTSRAWSYPDYDDFVIYDYQLENTGNRLPAGGVDTLRAVMVAWGYSLAPSMFADERANNGTWLEGSFRSDKPDVSKISLYARFDWNRYMIYDHTLDGVPDAQYFGPWATNNQNGGGLTAPQAVGFLPLYYDYSHLATKYEVNVALNGNTYSDSSKVWDSNNKLKQPYNIRWDNANLYLSKLQSNLNPEQVRYEAPFRTSSDSLAFGVYWIGRGRPTWSNTLRNPTGKMYGFGPYTLAPGQTMHFVVAEVAGYGAGVASDRQYSDVGGGWGGNGSPAEPNPGTHPVPSWYDTLRYAYLNNLHPDAAMGSTYLQHYRLPDYVNSNVISIRDVADRAIQMFKGGPVIKYDTLQFEPSGGAAGASPTGVYRVPIPCPAPAIVVQNTRAGSNLVVWGSQAESFSRHDGRLHAPFSHYLVEVASSPLGPWRVLDSVGRHDPRYFKDTTGLGNVSPLVLHDSAYVFIDYSSEIGAGYYYAVVSVDQLGGHSGKTNLVFHSTQTPAVTTLGKVYAAPNPFIVTSHSSGTSVNGDIANKIGFFGLPKHATIRIFSYSGQLVQTIEHDSDEYSAEWFEVSRNNQWIASGVYYFTVDDDKGNRSWNKFVIIH